MRDANPRLRSWKRPERLHRVFASVVATVEDETRQAWTVKLRIDEVIPKHAMGDGNSIYDLQNYVVGEGSQGVKESGSQGAGFGGSIILSC